MPSTGEFSREPRTGSRGTLTDTPPSTSSLPSTFIAGSADSDDAGPNMIRRDLAAYGIDSDLFTGLCIDSSCGVADFAFIQQFKVYELGHGAC